jgi:AraC-like DNA-binding protein
MHYREIKPLAGGSAYVKVYWEMAHSRDEIVAGPEPVLPDGCVEMVFDLKDKFLTYSADNTTVEQPRTMVAGQLTSRILIGPSGDTEMFGVRLHPHAAFSILGIAMNEIRDRIVDLADVMTAGFESTIFDRLSAAKSFEERIAIFETAFIHRENVSARGELTECLRLMIVSDGAFQVSKCANRLGWSERRLERVFQEQIGMGPKLYSRIIRFKSFLNAVESRRASLLDRALAVGYHDQSHMIRDFRHFAGMTPTEFFGRELVFGDRLSGL